MVDWFSLHYLPKGKLIDFFHGRWAVWCDDPPEWFDEEFREQVPRELLVKVDESLWAKNTDDEDEEEGVGVVG